LRLEGAEHGILATAVCPACVRTPMVESQVPPGTGAHGMPDERVLEEVILAPQAAKRLLEPAEVADTVAYLLGPGGAPSPAPPSQWAWVERSLSHRATKRSISRHWRLFGVSTIRKARRSHPKKVRTPARVDGGHHTLAPASWPPCLGFEDGVGVGHDHEAG
jgi:hypothetical protein